jgi:hypothetical protein
LALSNRAHGTRFHNGLELRDAKIMQLYEGTSQIPRPRDGPRNAGASASSMR